MRSTGPAPVDQMILLIRKQGDQLVGRGISLLEKDTVLHFFSDKKSFQDVQSNSVQRFRGGLVSKAHRLLYHSTLCLKVLKKKKKRAAHKKNVVVGFRVRV